MSGSTLKELQREWYQKLADSGFVDIEAKLDDRGGFQRPFREDLARSNYYTAVGHALEQSYGHLHGRLLSHRQRILMYSLERHAQGVSTRSICIELQELGLKPNRRNTINAWIKQFVHAIGLRYYSPEDMRNL
jgi:hypothetical protein